MITVPVRVDHELHWLVRELADGTEQARRHRRVLVVDDEHAIRTGGDTDIAAATVKYMHRTGDQFLLDGRRFRKCGLRERRGGNGAHQQCSERTVLH